MKKGSALLSVLVMLAALSIMVMSFIYEAHQQGGINYVIRERNRAARVIDAGQALAEIVLLNYSSVSDWSADQDTAKLLEDDRWVVEKQNLKSDGKCTIGPILLDEEQDDDGTYVNPTTVTIDIESVNSGSTGIININNLYSGGGDGKYMERWWMIFQSHNIPETLSTEKEGTVNLWNILIASWNDWRDEDDTVTDIDGDEAGAESQWYEDDEKDRDLDEEDYHRPRNKAIPDVKELAFVRGFKDYPAVLTGGVINPWEKPEDQITVKGIQDLFTTVGSMKINVNTCDSVDALVTIPGIYEDPEDDNALDEAREVAQAILDARKTMPEDYEVDESRSWWPFKDWNDLIERCEDEDIGSEASQYFSFAADSSTIFKVTITAESMGAKHIVNAECYLKDSAIRYIKWRED